MITVKNSWVVLFSETFLIPSAPSFKRTFQCFGLYWVLSIHLVTTLLPAVNKPERSSISLQHYQRLFTELFSRRMVQGIACFINITPVLFCSLHCTARKLNRSSTIHVASHQLTSFAIATPLLTDSQKRTVVPWHHLLHN